MPTSTTARTPESSLTFASGAGSNRLLGAMLCASTATRNERAHEAWPPAVGRVCETQLQAADRAIDASRDALSLVPDEPRALEALGRLYERSRIVQASMNSASSLCVSRST
jgi:hypothetical protein